MARFDNIVVAIKKLKDLVTLSKEGFKILLREQRMEEVNNDKEKSECFVTYV